MLAHNVFEGKKKKWVLIQPGERRRNQLTNKSNEQSKKILASLEMFKTLYSTSD